MAYLGRYQLGTEVPLAVQCKNASGVPTSPDAAPTVTIYSATSVKVDGFDGKKIPTEDRYQVTGLFAYRAFLGSRFAEGQYSVVYQWATGGGAFTGKEIDTFDIIPGGDPDGAVISMHVFNRPHAQFVVQHFDSGKLAASRNPSV